MQAFDDNWLRVAEVAPAIWRIDELYIEPSVRGLIWVIEGTELRLIFDGGCGLIPLNRRLPWLFERPHIAVASHTHFDHIGAMHLFAETACHPLEADILANPDQVSVQILPFLEENSAIIADPTSGFRPKDYHIKGVSPARLIDDGDLFDLGGRVLEVLFTPGHSPGHVALFERSTGDLFSADSIHELPLVDDIPGACRETLIATHARLRALPVQRVFPGHYEPFDGARMRLLIDRYEHGENSCAI